MSRRDTGKKKGCRFAPDSPKQQIDHSLSTAYMNPSQFCKVALDRRLTFAARGLLICLSQMQPEERRESRLLELAPSGKQHLRATLQELERHGYLVRAAVRNPNGTMHRSLWMLPTIDAEVA